MEKQSIKAEILADSIERVGNNRITTFKLIYPRIIHAELLTHRLFSKNAASSRAIPVEKKLQQIIDNPFIPIAFQREHKGMQGVNYLNLEETKIAIKIWLEARDKAVEQAKKFIENKVTKQIINRLLEPFEYIAVILTGTEFENFFALRAHSMAEIHLQDLAYKMLEAYNLSTPKELKEGEWHIPFENEIDIQDWYNINKRPTCAFWNELESYEQDSYLIKVSTAKCAQVSYMKFGSDDYADLIDLHDSLFIRPYNGKRGIREINDPIHASPAEHIAQAMTEEEYYSFYKSYTVDSWIGTEKEYGWCHNLKGFKSYRSMLPNENSTDSRVIKK